MTQESGSAGEAMEGRLTDAEVPTEEAPRTAATGSPFVVGRPLRASEIIFGRDDLFRSVAGQLAKFSSVNVVGERRMGKTSFLNHLVDHPAQHLGPQPGRPPLILACVDLQAGVSHARRLYGVALRELLGQLPVDQDAPAAGLEGLRERLRAKPEASYDGFERVLKYLREGRDRSVRPVLIVDEFERLIEPAASEGFPYPDFFNGLRALITADLLAMVIFSCHSLAYYFRDPDRPGSLTSTFPTYFTLFRLGPLDDEAADVLLLQPSDHTLTLRDVDQAKRWAGGHPCHLQVAGQAWYEAKAAGRTLRWTRKRFKELKSQNCMAGPGPRGSWRLVRRVLRFVFRDLPIRIGQVAQHLGMRFSELAAWMIGTAVIVTIVLVVLGVAEGADLLALIKRALGLR